MRYSYFSIVFILLCLFSKAGYAQSDTLGGFMVLENLPPEKIAKNALFIELLGNGGLYSLNYDRWLSGKKSVRLTTRIGYSITYYNDFDHTFIVEPCLLIGKNAHNIEIAPGVTYVKTGDKGWEYQGTFYNTELLLFGRLGYRYQQRQGERVFVRLALTPNVYSQYGNSGGVWNFRWYFAAAAGFSF